MEKNLRTQTILIALSFSFPLLADTQSQRDCAQKVKRVCGFFEKMPFAADQSKRALRCVHREARKLCKPKDAMAVTQGFESAKKKWEDKIAKVKEKERKLREKLKEEERIRKQKYKK